MAFNNMYLGILFRQELHRISRRTGLSSLGGLASI